MAILNHDFIETNADTFSLTIPFMVKNCYHFYAGHKTDDNLLFDSYLLSLCVFVSLTNEFHKVRKPIFLSDFNKVVTLSTQYT